MGRDKAGLRFGAETLLERVVRRLAAVAAPVVVALAHGAPERPLPPGVRAVRDALPEQGPLLGLAAGFRELLGKAEGVIVVPVDLPFLSESWLARLGAGLEQARAVLYQDGEFRHALTAAYRLELWPKLERLVREGRRGPLQLSAGESPLIVRVEEHWVPEQEPPPLLDVDSPDAYRDALRLDGFGTAQGAAMTLTWDAGPRTHNELPLWAASAEDALGIAARVLPEAAAVLSALRERGRVLLHKPDGERPTGWNEPLRDGDRLRLLER
jgi:molybdopterin-guanine dinucleotide biosynthesis protein A